MLILAVYKCGGVCLLLIYWLFAIIWLGRLLFDWGRSWGFGSSRSDIRCPWSRHSRVRRCLCLLWFRICSCEWSEFRCIWGWSRLGSYLELILSKWKHSLLLKFRGILLHLFSSFRFDNLNTFGCRLFLWWFAPFFLCSFRLTFIMHILIYLPNYNFY